VSGADGRDNRHLQFVREFASVVSVLQDKTNNVIDLYRDILRAVEDLATCLYTSEAFSELLSKIQAVVCYPPSSVYLTFAKLFDPLAVAFLAYLTLWRSSLLDIPCTDTPKPLKASLDVVVLDAGVLLHWDFLQTCQGRRSCLT